MSTDNNLAGSEARLSIAVAADGFFGHPLPIVLRRSLPGALHTVTVDCAGRRTVLLQKSPRYPLLVWETALTDYAPLLPDRAEAEARIAVETYLDGQRLGETVESVTMRIPQGALAPGFREGWVSLLPDNGPDASLHCLAAGRSRVEAVFDPGKLDEAGLLGASVAGFQLEAPGETVTRSPYRSGVLTGPTRLRCTVLDSRGQRSGQDFLLTPRDYAPPALGDLRLSRSGAAATLRVSLTYSPLDGENACSLSAALRPVGGSFGAELPLTPDTDTSLSGLDPARSYECRVRARDRLGAEAELLGLLPAERWAMKFRPGGLGVAFGKAPGHDRALELPADWEIRLGEESLFLRLHPVGSAVLADTAPAQGVWENAGALAGTTAWKRIG